MGSTNRRPEIDRQAMRLFEQTSKATWAELFVDLYRQTHGENAPAHEWMADVEKRIAILTSPALARVRRSREDAERYPLESAYQREPYEGASKPVPKPAPSTNGSLALASAPAAVVFACRPETVEAPVPAPKPMRSGGFEPSAYQAAIFDFIRGGQGDGIVNAVAGSGKTTTLVQGAKLLHEPALFMAFNKHIADELAGRLAGTPMIARTIHSTGFACVNAHLGKTRVDGNKYRVLIDRAAAGIKTASMDEHRKVQDAIKSLTNFVRLTLTDPGDRDALIALVDHHGVELPSGLEHLVLDAVPDVLEAGIAAAANGEHVIDFADMLYLPYVWKLQPPTAGWVFVDECQDLSAAQLDLVLKCRAPGGRMLFVGDPRQAIYGFAGSDAESYRNIQRRTNATELPLSICYRCPAGIVDLARTIVPEIQARPDAPAGIIEHVREAELSKTLTRGDLVLCRLTAPLVRQCLDLIAQRVSARVRGRDIGKQLADLVQDVTRMPEYTWERFGDSLGAYENTKANKLAQRANTESQIEALHDRCDAVRVCYDSYHVSSARDLAYEIEQLFTDEDAAITLSTVHRAKGLENSRVVILKPEKLPLTWAKQKPWQAEQESNLQYVAYTRAMDALYFADA